MMTVRGVRPLSALTRLALGASVGALCAILVLLGDSAGRGVDASAVASVNGSRLDLGEYQRAVRLFASEKRSAVTMDDRSLILERMIEEELLLQYGVAAGLVRDHPAVRAEALRSVMTSLTAEQQARGDDEVDRGPARYDPLAEYLGQLRSGAAIRWSTAGVTQ
jgi:hypothetical protein